MVFGFSQSDSRGRRRPSLDMFPKILAKTRLKAIHTALPLSYQVTWERVNCEFIFKFYFLQEMTLRTRNDQFSDDLLV